MREKYESLSLAILRDIAKRRNMKGTSGLKKADLIERLLLQDELDKQNAPDSGKTDIAKQPEESEKAKSEQSGAVNQAEEAVVLQKESAGSDQGEKSGNRPEESVYAGQAANEDVSADESAGARQEEHASADTEVKEERHHSSKPAEERRRIGSAGRSDGNGRRNESGTARGQQRRQNTSRNENNGKRNNRNGSDQNGQGEHRNNGGHSQDSRNNQRKHQTRQTERNAAASRPSNGESNVRKPAEAPVSETENTAAPATAVTEQTQAAAQEKPPVKKIYQYLEEDDLTKVDLPRNIEAYDTGITAKGILEVMTDGFGFLRGDNYLSSSDDIYVSPSLIRRFGLKTGDVITGHTRYRSQGEKFNALLFVSDVNGDPPYEAAKRPHFEDLTPVFPDERVRLETPGSGVAMRIMDLISPVGKGQRGMIVSPPKAGKTTLLKEVAKAVLQNNPEMHMIILLIDERPEEVTDMKEAITGDNVEVIYSTFDELPEHHRKVAEMVMERAKRLVEQKRDVIVLLDSITRLARAYNLIVPPSGRTLSGGLDPAALHMPKRFFGAARNMREGGSLTILATALVDTGSKMDDVVYEEFKGTGNMELVLDRKLSERRIFPAIDIVKSGTRREDLLLDEEEQEAVTIMRRGINGLKTDEAVETILNLFVHTKTNLDFVRYLIRRKIV